MCFKNLASVFGGPRSISWQIPRRSEHRSLSDDLLSVSRSLIHPTTILAVNKPACAILTCPVSDALPGALHIRRYAVVGRVGVGGAGQGAQAESHEDEAQDTWFDEPTMV